MLPTATDVLTFRDLYVLLYVGHDREFYKSGCTDRDRLSAAVRTHDGPTEPRSGRGSDPPQERHFGACYRM